jgi:hypothetical protein
MVIDEVGSQRFPRYLVYDIVRFENIQVGKTDFLTRITCIKKEIVGARNNYINKVATISVIFHHLSFRTMKTENSFFLNI